MESPKYQQYINGEWIDAVDKQTIPLINPATEEEITRISFGNEKDAVLAIDAAHCGLQKLEQNNTLLPCRNIKKSG